MKVVVDTSVLIDHLRGDARAATVLRQRIEVGDELWSVTPVRTEILAGMRPREAAVTLALLDSLAWQDVTMALADHAGALANRYLRSHPGVDTIDYLIAAAAEFLSAELLTKNVKHFPMFRDLLAAY